MAWSIELDKKAKKELASLAKPVQQKIEKFILKLAAHVNPRNLGYCLKGELYLWRFRVGDYRLLCKIKDEEITILVVAIGHRKEVYR